MARVRHVLSAAALLPALAGAALALPAVRQLAVEQLDRPAPIATSADLEPVAVTANSGVGWGVSVWPAQPTRPRVAPRAPAAPPRPTPPPRPWEVPGADGSTLVPYTAPPLVLGPVVHVVQRLAEGGHVVLPPAPAGLRLAHLLCTGPTTPLATYHLDSSDPAATVVYRQDYSGVFDFYYRYVSYSYVPTQPCS
jgi:hypothetical protein